MKKFLCSLSAIITVLLAGCLTACQVGLDFSSSSNDSEQSEEPVRIIAVYEQSTQVFENTPLDDLRADLTVSLETSLETVTETDDYTLSGTLAVGESEITVTYNPVPALTATFNVSVSETSTNTHTHVFTNYVSNGDATCTQDGTKTAVCDDASCQETDTIADVGSKLDHVFENYVSNNDATCTADGTKTASCKYGCKTADTVTDVGSKLDHVFENYVSNNDATCTQDGTEKATCDRENCEAEDTRTDVGSALGHSHTPTVTAPTCTEKGFTTHTCACGDSYVDTYVNALGHTFGSWELTTAPTCTEKGEETRVCECKATETREVAAKNHNFGAWEVIEQPTCTKGGLEKRVCANDSTHVEEKPLEKLPHDYSKDWKHDTVNHWKECDCGDKTENGEHDWDDGTVKTPAGEYTKGVMLYTCTVCTEMKEEPIAPLGHTHAPVNTPAKEATCTENGNFEYWYCAGCEMYFSDAECEHTVNVTETVIPATHTLTHVAAKDKTCTENGNVEYWYCSACETYFSDANAKTEITQAQTVVQASHTLTHVAAKDKTCTENGNVEYWYCSACKKYFSDSKAETEIAQAQTVVQASHTLTHVAAKDKTCTENGYEAHYQCSVCEKYFSDQAATTEITFESIVIKAAHTALATSVTAATCTEAGATTTTCGDCDYVNVETSAALGHSFKQSQCERCSATNNLSIVTAPSVTTSIYYGEQPTLTGGEVENELGETVTSGVWSIAVVSYSASATTEEIAAKAFVTFTPNGTEYASVSQEIDVTLLAVAQYGNNYYATIDGALEKANDNNSGTVHVLPLGYELDSGRAKTAKTIAVVGEIKSGVTLTLPYAEDALDTTVSYVVVSDDNYQTSSFGNAQFLTNQIYIKQGHTLENAGIINVAGEISSGKAETSKIPHSVTAGRHAQINLGANAKLASEGTVNCYGFINEETKNNGSEFIVEKGKATVMFTIVEYRGPRIYLGMLNPEKNSTVYDNLIAAVKNGKTYTPDTMQSSPFNRFYIESVTAKTTVKHGAQMLGHAVLYAYNEHCQTTLNLINDSDAVIALTEQGGWVTYKYDPSTHKTDLDIYGNMTLNPLQLELTLTISGYSAKLMLTTGATGDSDGVFFPISDYFDISLNAVNGSATVDASAQKVKLLPGAKLTIGEDVVVNASEIAVYANNNLLVGGVNTHYKEKTPAELIVKGTLNVQKLGGTVKAGGDNARLNITKSNSVISKEIATASGTSKLEIALGKGLQYVLVTYSSDADSTLTAAGATVNGDPLGVNEYTAQNGLWIPANIAVQYNLNGGTASATSQSFAYGYELKTSDLLVPEREYYDFAGWYTTENFESGTQFESVTLTKNLTLYAKWEQKAGIVLVEFKAVGTDANDVEITKTFGSQVINENSKCAVEPTKAVEYNQKTAYARYVEGYYLDEACTVAFSFSQELTQNTTIYVKWANKIKVTIGSGTSSVTAGGKTMTATEFYVVPNTEIKVSAKTDSAFLSKKTVTITESFGSKSASNSTSFGSATATLTFNAVGDTTVTITKS